MIKLISSIKNRIFRIDKEKVICFTLLNRKKFYDKNPEVINYIQRDLAEIGALVARHHFNLFCVTLANQDVKTDDILKIFKNHNIKVKIKTKGKNIFKEQKVIKLFPKRY